MNKTVASGLKLQTAEQHLAERIVQGDKQAFGQLYDRYAPVLLGIISRRVGEGKIANDILQKTFLDIYDQIPVFPASKLPLLSWILNITRKTIAEALAEIPAADNFVHRADIPLVELTKQPGKNKYAALDLLVLNGHSFEKTAAILGLQPGELKNKLRTEFKQLRTNNPNE